MSRAPGRGTQLSPSPAPHRYFLIRSMLFYDRVFLSDILNEGVTRTTNPFQLLSVRRQENIQPNRSWWAALAGEN